MTILLFAGFFLLEAANRPSRARMFPNALLWGMVAVGRLLVLQALAGRLRGAGIESDAAEAEPSMIPSLVFPVAIPGALLLAAYGLLTVVGFYGTVPFLVTTLYLYHIHRTGAGNLTWRVALGGVTFALAVTLVSRGRSAC